MLGISNRRPLNLVDDWMHVIIFLFHLWPYMTSILESSLSLAPSLAPILSATVDAIAASFSDYIHPFPTTTPHTSSDSSLQHGNQTQQQ